MVPESLKIGETIVSQVPSAKLLGVVMDEDQSWTSQILGTSGMISSLNSRLFIIKRLSAALSKNRLNTIIGSFYTSKVRYGLQLYGEVRTNEEAKKTNLFKTLQKA